MTAVALLPPILLDHLFSRERHRDFKQKVAAISDQEWWWEARSQRRYLYHPGMTSTPFRDLLPRVEARFGVPLRLNYTFMAQYCAQSDLVIHTDRPGCDVTVDYCLQTTHPWPIYIDSDPYTLTDNQAVIFQGRQHQHYRNLPEVPAGETFSCTMIFFHYSLVS